MPPTGLGSWFFQKLKISQFKSPRSTALGLVAGGNFRTLGSLVSHTKIISFFKIFQLEPAGDSRVVKLYGRKLQSESRFSVQWPELRKKNQVKSLIEKQKLRKFQGKSPIQFNPETRFGNCRQLACVADFSKNWTWSSQFTYPRRKMAPEIILPGRRRQFPNPGLTSH